MGWNHLRVNFQVTIQNIHLSCLFVVQIVFDAIREKITT